MADPVELHRLADQPSTTTPARTLAVRAGHATERADRVVTEEPLEIRAAGPGQEPAAVAVTMRTPGHDFELAVGFLFTEAIVSGPDDVTSVRYCDVPGDEQRYNVVSVHLTRPFDPSSLQRNFFATSSCGVCGKASLEQVRTSCPHLPPGPTVDAATIVALPDRLRSAQRVFDRTGGLHAAGLFDPSGALLRLREDVGRHNAVDAVVGRSVLDREIPLHDRTLMVSGRVSFEIVQKAAMAGVPVLCAVSAPSSLAVDAARDLGMTLVAFVRGEGFNVYSGPERVTGVAGR